MPAGVEVCGACLLDPPPFAAAVAAADYAYPWDDLVQRLKFHAALDLAGALAALLCTAVRQRNGLPPPDRLVPVPLHATRLRERGYNQSWEITRRVARDLARPADARLLLRPMETAHQVALPHAQRAANVRGALAVEPRRRHEVQDRVVAVVDDVMTTGATAAEAAAVLLRAGARSVQVWVVARTPLPRVGGAD